MATEKNDREQVNQPHNKTKSIRGVFVKLSYHLLWIKLLVLFQHCVTATLLLSCWVSLLNGIHSDCLGL